MENCCICEPSILTAKLLEALVLFSLINHCFIYGVGSYPNANFKINDSGLFRLLTYSSSASLLAIEHFQICESNEERKQPAMNKEAIRLTIIA